MPNGEFGEGLFDPTSRPILLQLGHVFLAFIQNRDDLFPYHVVQFLHEHPNFWNKYRPNVFRSGTHHANHLYRLGGVYAGSRGRVF